ncbi:unnamed protein product, partial [Tuber aestivum]
MLERRNLTHPVTKKSLEFSLLKCGPLNASASLTLGYSSLGDSTAYGCLPTLPHIIRPQRSTDGGFGGSKNVNDIILTRGGVADQSGPCSPASPPSTVAEGSGSRNVGPHWMVAYGRNEYFTGRQESISRIQELSEGNSHNRISLYGSGGAGKSQLAIEYVYRNEGLRNIFWVHGSSFLSFSQGFGSISQYIDTPDSSAGATEHGLLSNVKRWLES